MPVADAAAPTRSHEKDAAAAMRWMIWRRDNHSQFQKRIPSLVLIFMAIDQNVSFIPNCISRGLAAVVITPKVLDGMVQVSGPMNWV
jgi:hypothetical protein